MSMALVSSFAMLLCIIIIDKEQKNWNGEDNATV